MEIGASSANSQNKDYEVFEPDYETKQKWLSTRKEEHNSTHVHLPGFYQDSTSRTDLILFWLAFSVELTTAIFILIGGLMKHNASHKWAAIANVFFLLLLDGIGAYLVHKMKGKYCELDNKILADPENEHSYKMQKVGAYYKTIGKICIIFSAILKSIGVLLFTKISLTIFFVLLLIYAFIVYVHIAHTGYYWAHVFFQKSYDTQFDKFSEDKHRGHKSVYAATIIERKIITPIDLEITSKNANNHTIEFKEKQNENGKDIYHYTLSTKGVLQDSEIFLFLSGLTDAQTTVISQTCLKQQALSIHTPNTISHSIKK